MGVRGLDQSRKVRSLAGSWIPKIRPIYLGIGANNCTRHNIILERTELEERAAFDINSHGAAPEELVPSWSDLGELSEKFKRIVDSEPDSLVLERRWIHSYGWPARCLWSYWYKVDPGDSPPTYGSEGYIYQFGSWNDFVPRALPTRPIWLGFILNTIFYAAILWLPFVPFKLRRTIRCKRGLCIQCGYDLRGTDHNVCPECGTKLSPPFSPG